MTHECEGGDRSEGVNAKVRVRKWIVYSAVMNTAKVRTKAVKVNMVTVRLIMGGEKGVEEGEIIPIATQSPPW